MKFFVLCLALCSAAMADVSELGYNYQAPSFGPIAGGGGFGNSQSSGSFGQTFGGGFGGAPSNAYIPPEASVSVPSNSYIPPGPAPAPVFQTYSPPTNTYIPPPVGNSFGGGFGGGVSQVAFADISNSIAPPVADFGTELADDGYRYRTVRRRVYRTRI
uniref:Uncharacterized protein n=1 Tax=Musca domestica TaxID=7370 RepID=A0A1I8M0J1_MUSDO